MMILRYVFLSLVILPLRPLSAAAQKIIYDLPKEVTEKADDFLRKQKGSYSILFSSLDSGRFSISFLKVDNSDKNFELINSKLIQRSNRFLRVKDMLYPIITREDLQFADFGTENTPNSGSHHRRNGKIKVHLTSDEYSITFDKTGIIYP